MLDDGLGPGWMIWRRRRYIVALLAFIGFFNAYALRVNMSVAIVAMTTERNVTLENGTSVTIKDFDWDLPTQGMLHSSFFYGYIVTQLPGGWLATRIGGNKVYGIGIAVTALLTLMTPPLASISYYLLLAVRIIEGVFQGVIFPCMHGVWSKWAPPLERSRLAMLAYTGTFAGTVAAMPLCGILANQVGWPSIFYVFGTLGVLWFVIWWIVVKEAPEMDPHITSQELKYIQESLGSQSEANKTIHHPWNKFLTSLPVWAIVVSHFCANWGFYTLLTHLPTFLRDIMDFEVEKAGFMSALPYLAMGIMVQAGGCLADWLCTSGLLTTTQVRKVLTCGAFVGQTVFMLMAAHLLTPAGAVTCLTIAVGLGGVSWSGWCVNHLDIAPQHASVLMGFSNTFGTLPGVISPAITGFIVRNRNAHEWQYVFYIASAIYMVGAIFYWIFASGECQSWAMDDHTYADKGSSTQQTQKSGYVNGALTLETT